MSGARPPLLAVVGATGTGKSELAIELAEALAGHGIGADAINADAMQLYRGMSIGTAKLGVGERRGVPHHLFDALDVSEESTVAGYQALARPLIAELRAAGRAPILVGGSGLYVSAAVYDFRFPGADPALRAELEAEHAAAGLGGLVARLCAADPAAAATVDLRNPRRVIRALEVLAVTGEPIAAALPETPEPLVPTRLIGLAEERGVLTARLDRRVEGMWRDGLLDEVAELRERGLERGSTAPQAIGYAQALAQLRGDLDAATAIAETQALTRRYARRQTSWFRRYRPVTWLPSTGPERDGAAARIAAEIAAGLAAQLGAAASE